MAYLQLAGPGPPSSLKDHILLGLLESVSWDVWGLSLGSPVIISSPCSWEVLEVSWHPADGAAEYSIAST